MKKNLFKWKHFQKDIILLCVRWYLKYPLSYRNLVDMMIERGNNSFSYNNNEMSWSQAALAARLSRLGSSIFTNYR